MDYNIKIIEYPDNIQVSLYEKTITRSDDNEEYITNNKPYNFDMLQTHWYDSKDSTYKIIPKKHVCIVNPFTNKEELLEVLPDDKEYIKNAFRNFRRTKQNIYSIARGSIWDLFITLTIKDSSRYDLEESKKRVSKKINNIRRDYAPNLKYIIIFERHPTSQAWHVHGLLKGIEGLTLTKAINPHTNKVIKKHGLTVYNIKEFNSLGFSTASHVQDNNRVTHYIIKYISKDLCFDYPDKHSYLCSKGLPRGSETFYNLDNLEELYAILEDKYKDKIDMTHVKTCYNVFNDSYIKYMQFAKGD
ncbi:MAG: hypothetical protein E7271_05080 [Lachnospiraceae bacterium]|jgi:hypothetical protein|nr:hypothetical protein [Lachnospiraceae bacterium]